MRLPKISGFSADRADAFWLTCDLCDEQELFYGADPAGDAEVWANVHRIESHADAD